MPIYEYQCESCGEILEVIQKFSDEPLTTCSKCNGSLKKLISNCTFHLKGSGWYVTDYANKSSMNSKEKNNTGGKSESKSSACADSSASSTGAASTKSD
jgi:putative FmdB family regulatory protein